MNYSDFFQRFGGSLRTKHLGKRPVDLPSKSGAPRDLIRLDPWEAEYLFNVAQAARVGILEIGRHKGGSTLLLACTNSGVPIHSIDIAPRDDAALSKIFADEKIGGNVDLIDGDSRIDRPEIDAVDLLFIDGDHSYQGCYADIATWHNRVVKGGHVVFHDSYAGAYGVQQAIVDFLVGHPEFEVVTSHVIAAEHWKYPAGSIAHLVKR